MQQLDQTIQRALAALLTDQLLGDRQLLLTVAQRHEFQRLRVLHQGTQQRADAQRRRTVDAQRAAAQRGVEQAHHRTKHRRLARHLRQHLRGQHFALQQGADRQLRRVDTGEGGDAGGDGLLHGDGQIARRRLSDRQAGALGQRLGAGGLDRGLAAAVEGDLEQQLKGLIRLLERQHFSLGGLTGGDQALHRRQQLEQIAAHYQRPRSRGRGLRYREDVHFACHTRSQPEEIALFRVGHGMYNAAPLYPGR